MDHAKLKELQIAQTEVLAEFHKFCEKHNLKYFMAYGTLLGAVRHKGFIPWDNDIDTFMTRTEYEKFVKVQDQLPNHLHVWEVCYSDMKHAGLIRIWRDFGHQMNAQIDIFILDYEKLIAPRRFCTLLYFAKLSKSEKSILIHHFKGAPLKQAVIYFSKIVRLLLLGSSNCEKLIFNLRVNKKPSSHYITLQAKYRFPVEYFEDTELLDFEEYKFCAPLHKEEVLTEMYGNYMEIPPEGLKWMEDEHKNNKQF